MNAKSEQTKKSSKSQIDIEMIARNLNNSDYMTVIESKRENRASVVTDIALNSSKVYNQTLRNSQLRAGSQANQIVRFVLVAPRGKIIASAVYDYSKREVKLTNEITHKAIETRKFNANVRINYQLVVHALLKSLDLITHDETSNRNSSKRENDLIAQIAQLRGVSVEQIKKEIAKQSQKSSKTQKSSKSQKSSKTQTPRVSKVETTVIIPPADDTKVE